MADDDIEKLLREVEAMNSPAASKPQPAPATGTPRTTDAAPGSEVARTNGSSGAAKKFLVAGAAGAIASVIALFIFGVIPFIGDWRFLNELLAGFVGGAVGYGAARVIDRPQKQ
jgi:hypothetical protein